MELFEKRCSDCGELKPVAEFPSWRKTVDGRPRYASYCRPCANRRSAARARANPERSRRHSRESKRRHADRDNAARRALGYRLADRAKHFRRTYGITIEDWLRMLAEQRGQCAICGAELLGKVCVDHDHDTGAVRGLLCDPCNKGIGALGDDPDRVESALRYLRHHEEKHHHVDQSLPWRAGEA